MMKNILIATFVSALLLSGCESTNTGSPTTMTTGAGSANDLADFVGARAGQAEGGLVNKGYVLARTEGLTAYWWNENTQACIRIVTNQGRFESVDTASRSDCGK
jgi:outer membrane lipoprotein SlyB